MVGTGTNPDTSHFINWNDAEAMTHWPINYISWKSGPEADAYWVVPQVDEPR
jgi:hypothetical protein